MAARGNLRRVVVSSRPAAVVAVGPGATRPAPAPLPVGRAFAGPRVRLPASTYRRRRAVAAGLVVGVVLVLWAALGVFGGGPLLVPERPDPSGGRLTPGVTYVVQPGDTFWSIAARLKPGGDPRPLVDRLVATHGGSTLHVGEHLRLPA
ncbi:MAG: LysM peptidoglycan-binding domain-containing protein [Acidimicrobiales bacterium]